jgi:D-glycero-alpha-D-manno-heptose-7-phosphate kinase
VQDHGGIVLSATIDRFAYATLRFPTEKVIRVRSLDYNTLSTYRFDEPLVLDGELDLVKACLRRLLPGVSTDTTGVEIYLETEAPPGSGLGASSALVVALVGALLAWRHVPMDKYEIARVAWEIERKDVGIPGGLQDQYAATFGGFNLIEFQSAGGVIVNSLRIDPSIVRELQYNMLLVFSGGTRVSSRIIEDQISGYMDRREGSHEAFDRMKALTIDAKNALLTGRLAALGHILHEEFLEKKKTARLVVTPQIEEIYEEARRLGVIGGKVSGAGGGGYMFLYCPFDRKPRVIKRIQELGGEVVPMAFEAEGMQTWLWPDEVYSEGDKRAEELPHKDHYSRTSGEC